MARIAGGRGYDMVILSDHGMTPARSYRVLFGESLGATVERLLDAEVVSSHSDVSEYAGIGPEVIEAVATITPPGRERTRRVLRRAKNWLRSRYGLRERLIPEKYRVAATHDVVITYSSCLALLYFADEEQPLTIDDIIADPRRKGLYDALLAHPGIGVIATRATDGVRVESASGTAMLRDGTHEVLAGDDPMQLYGPEPYSLRAIESLVMQHNAGDCVLMGAYDGEDIVSFDDQVGAHGSAGGDQVYPFILGPAWLSLESETLEDARDIHRAVLLKYSASRES
jgi:hypothetical protein